MTGQQRPRLADGLASTEVDVGRRQVLQAFVVASVIVVLDKARDMTSRAGPLSDRQLGYASGLVPPRKASGPSAIPRQMASIV